MIANGRYPNAVPSRLVRAVEQAGHEGLTSEAACATAPKSRVEDVRNNLALLVKAGRIHGAGHGKHRRWFADKADALIWNETGRPRTDRELRDAARAANAQDKEARRAARLAKLAEPRGAKEAWPPEHLEILQRMYTEHGPGPVAALIGKTRRACTAKARRLGLTVKKPGPRPKVARVRRKSSKPREDFNVVVLPGTAGVRTSKVRGPADMPGELIFTERTKYTIAPPAPAPLRTNTYSQFA